MSPSTLRLGIDLAAQLALSDPRVPELVDHLLSVVEQLPLSELLLEASASAHRLGIPSQTARRLAAALKEAKPTATLALLAELERHQRRAVA